MNHEGLMTSGIFNFWRAMQDIELKWIQQFQAMLRSPFLDDFFLGWNYIDTFPTMMLIIAMAWFFIDRRIGIQLFCVFLLSSVFNVLLKSFFGLPRPSQIDPTVAILQFSSPGFPSGAAQTAAIIAGICLIETQKKLYQYLGILFALLLCTSRVYLGVHFFTDILGGLCVGGFLVAIYWGLYFLTEKQLFTCFFLLALVLMIIDPSKFVVQSGLLSGVATGMLIGNKEMHRKDWLYRSLECTSALAGLFLLSALKDIYPTWKLLFVFSEGFWFSYMGGKIVHFFKSSKSKSSIL